MVRVSLTIWLQEHWEAINWFSRTGLILFVTVLILLNATSSFGFLSRAHIEEILKVTSGDADKVLMINQKIDAENHIIFDYSKQMTQIDDAISKLTETGSQDFAGCSGTTEKSQRYTRRRKTKTHRYSK